MMQQVKSVRVREGERKNKFVNTWPFNMFDSIGCHCEFCSVERCAVRLFV